MIRADEIGKILNAFRIGVMPNAILKDIVIGREKEIGEFNNILNRLEQDEISSFKIINGEYGSGKTFLLAYLKEMALEKNFVVGEVVLSSGFCFSDFSDFYTQLMSHLSVKSSQNKKGTSFEDIFLDWIEKLKYKKDHQYATKDIYEVISKLNDYNNSYASVLLSYIRGKINNDYELANLAASWIKGDKNIPYEQKRKLNIKGHVDKENAFEMLRSFAKLLSLMGYSGLVITIDEAEIIMNNRIDTRKKAYSNIRQIIDACGSNDIEKCSFIFAGTNKLLTDDVKGFKSYEPIFQRIGDSINSKSRTASSTRQPVIKLRSFTDADFYTLTKKIIPFHESYYHHEINPKLDTIYNLTMIECDKLKKNDNITIRMYLKKLVEIMDLMEENPELPIFNTKVTRIIK
jgi:hypothetical protein